MLTALTMHPWLTGHYIILEYDTNACCIPSLVMKTCLQFHFFSMCKFCHQLCGLYHSFFVQPKQQKHHSICTLRNLRIAYHLPSNDEYIPVTPFSTFFEASVVFCRLNFTTTFLPFLLFCASPPAFIASLLTSVLTLDIVWAAPIHTNSILPFFSRIRSGLWNQSLSNETYGEGAYLQLPWMVTDIFPIRNPLPPSLVSSTTPPSKYHAKQSPNKTQRHQIPRQRRRRRGRCQSRLKLCGCPTARGPNLGRAQGRRRGPVEP